MPKIRRKRGHYRVRSNKWCVWCGKLFMSNHSNAKTDTPRCRVNLSRFNYLTGFDPEEPPGNSTAYGAYSDLVNRLLDAERVRRELLEAVQSGGAAKLFEVSARITAEKKTTKRTKTQDAP